MSTSRSSSPTSLQAATFVAPDISAPTSAVESMGATIIMAVANAASTNEESIKIPVREATFAPVVVALPREVPVPGTGEAQFLQMSNQIKNFANSTGIISRDGDEEAQDADVRVDKFSGAVKLISDNKQDGCTQKAGFITSVTNSQLATDEFISPLASLVETLSPPENPTPDAAAPLPSFDIEPILPKPLIRKRPAHNPLETSKPKRSKVISGQSKDVVPQGLEHEIPQGQTEITPAQTGGTIQLQRHTEKANSAEAAQRRAAALTKKGTARKTDTARKTGTARKTDTARKTGTARKTDTAPAIEDAVTQRHQYIAELKSIPDFTVPKPSPQYSYTEPTSALDEKVTKKQYEAEQAEWAHNAAQLEKKDGSDGSKKQRTLIQRSFAHNKTMAKQLTANAQIAVLDPDQRVEHTFEQRVDALPERYAEIKPWSLGGNANMFDSRTRRPETLSKKVEVEAVVKMNPIQFEENAQGDKVMIQTINKNAPYITGFRGSMMGLKSILDMPGAHPNITITAHESDPKLIVVRMEDMAQELIAEIVKSRAIQKKATEVAEKKRLRDLEKYGIKRPSKKAKGGRVTKNKEKVRNAGTVA